MCRVFYIGFINSMLVDKTLIDYTSFFSPEGFAKNGDIILSYFDKRKKQLMYIQV